MPCTNSGLGQEKSSEEYLGLSSLAGPANTFGETGGHDVRSRGTENPMFIPDPQVVTNVKESFERVFSPTSPALSLRKSPSPKTKTPTGDRRKSAKPKSGKKRKLGVTPLDQSTFQQNFGMISQTEKFSSLYPSVLSLPRAMAEGGSSTSLATIAEQGHHEL